MGVVLSDRRGVHCGYKGYSTLLKWHSENTEWYYYVTIHVNRS